MENLTTEEKQFIINLLAAQRVGLLEENAAKIIELSSSIRMKLTAPETKEKEEIIK